MNKPAARTGTPGPDDAQVALKLYDLRREQVMRESRDTMIRWLPKSYEDIVEITTFDSTNNAAFRQVSSYFEMAYGMARMGAVHAELVAETCGEGLLLFAKVHPYLERFRAEVSPTAFSNSEWVVENTEYGASRFRIFVERLAQRAAEAESKA